MTSNSRLYIAIPLMDELENIPTLLNCLKSQTFRNFVTVICVNQPESFRFDESKMRIVKSNTSTISLLSTEKELDIRIIDSATEGNGWTGKLHGVGAARREIFNFISKIAMEDDLIISLDGDTEFGEGYFKAVVDKFESDKNIAAISIPYFHELSGNEIIDRAILRYEIYMRHYHLNLSRIGSPYNFTSLGSAIGFRLGDYKKIGGMSPKLSGEDFYFLQKMAKFKPLANHLDNPVFPQARFSDRVFFGTGPAMIKGSMGDWSSYPIYDYKSFDLIYNFFQSIKELYLSETKTIVDDYVSVGGLTPWSKLRANSKNIEQFTKSVHQNFDGLRTLQFLKSNHEFSQDEDSNLICRFLSKFYPDFVIPQNFSLENSSIGDLNLIRNFLFEEEMKSRFDSDNQLFK